MRCEMAVHTEHSILRRFGHENILDACHCFVRHDHGSWLSDSAKIQRQTSRQTGPGPRWTRVAGRQVGTSERRLWIYRGSALGPARQEWVLVVQRYSRQCDLHVDAGRQSVRVSGSQRLYRPGHLARGIYADEWEGSKRPAVRGVPHDRVEWACVGPTGP